MATLRSRIIRLAHERPELRAKLLPLLASERTARSATQAYGEHVRAVKNLLGALEVAVKKDAVQQREDPLNWGFAGSMEHVEELLQEALDFISGEAK